MPVFFPSPDRVLSLIHGHWIAASIATAAHYSFFDLIDSGVCTAAHIARKSNVSHRGAQSILDALVGAGLLKLSKGRYSNTQESKKYLVKGEGSYLGELSEALFFSGGVSHMWGELAHVVKKGSQVDAISPEVRSLFNPTNYVSHLINAIKPMTYQAARLASARLHFSRYGPARILDVGGGSGIFTSVFLKSNPSARALQVDRPNMNRSARQHLASLNLTNRFETIDGDFLDIDFSELKFDVVICSNYMHLKTRGENIATLKKIKKLLNRGGAILLNDYFLSGDRKGHPLVLLSSVNWLLLTLGGHAWLLSEVRQWLKKSGFKKIVSKPTGMVTTLILAR